MFDPNLTTPEVSPDDIKRLISEYMDEFHFDDLVGSATDGKDDCFSVNDMLKTLNETQGAPVVDWDSCSSELKGFMRKELEDRKIELEKSISGDRPDISTVVSISEIKLADGKSDLELRVSINS